VVVARGDARFLIPFYARKWSSDLIFVRAHVHKDFTHWMLGSVARAVVTSAPCTVQIVRDAAEDRAHTDERGTSSTRKRLVGEFAHWWRTRTLHSFALQSGAHRLAPDQRGGAVAIA
jgi:hypothetical protein